MTLKYTTVLQFADILRAAIKVPSWETGNSQANEAVGTGDDSETDFYLDQKNILSGTYTLYANAVAMIDVTDYALDLTTGKIILEAAGVTKLSTNDLTAEYQYIGIEMSEDYLTAVLERAEKEVDKSINSTFTDGTATQPTYPSETEIQESPGYFRDRIITGKKPLIDVVTTLDGDLAIDATTIPLTDASGYPEAGQIIIGSEVITYTGVTDNDLTTATRGALSSTAAVHTDLDAVHSTVLFLSNTIEGTAVTFTVQPWDTKMHATENGLIYSFADSVFSGAQTPDKLTVQDVANRVKIIYYYGGNTIDEDITRLALIFGKRQLMQDNISKAIIEGRDEFKPRMFNADMEEMQGIINSHIVLPMGNT